MERDFFVVKMIILWYNPTVIFLKKGLTEKEN